MSDLETAAVPAVPRSVRTGRTAAEAAARLRATEPGAEPGTYTREDMARAWDEGRNARPQYLGPDDGHYNDECMGWEDCHCGTYANPYRGSPTATS